MVYGSSSGKRVRFIKNFKMFLRAKICEKFQDFREIKLRRQTKICWYKIWEAKWVGYNDSFSSHKVLHIINYEWNKDDP